MAGLSAAVKLHQHGFKVKVLEASEKVGGRMRSLYGPAGVVEIGAQWMHGTVGNPVYDLAKKEGLMEEEEKYMRMQDETFGRMCFVKEGGEEVDEQVLEDVVSAYDDLLEELEQGMAAPAGSAEDYIRRRLGEEGALNKHAGLEDDVERVLEWKSRMFVQGNIDGSHPSTVSTSHFINFKELEGERILPVPCGYSKIVQSLANLLPADAVVTSARVSSISTLVDQEDEERIKLVCSNGQEYFADDVIVATSLGVLKHSDIQFDPELPQWKREAISRMGMGVVEKVFFEFTEDDMETMEEKGFCFRSILPRQQDEQSLSFLCRATGMYRVPMSRYVCMWLTGADVSEKLSKTSDEELISQFVQLVRAFARPTDQPHIPSPFNVVRGSYSFLSTSSTQEDIRALGEPVVVGSQQKACHICFAGEATHENFYGTVHGAYLAGEREARRMIRLRSAQPIGD
ncbi:hypothetical protein GUITHDRAFT_110590 [Guillardia theta CCMP2712]|uniref:Amine oxidase domain-containing protein n=1 Tax=Guillardia theta (strain CCMP2712) TaxID=905079 RepID=L1J4N2_GUITC|nr:hypothetical protein GUITHDRAFT_110590 [Guillardia theta CCMP2712]EKX43466.1 hypothetical protein GUITHDRAFT_110590 [Guillardia theta CCMP2712]|eukprot:XP_005830446.1 hypothetical protein GUITHDRAFT_110590 [Guillardia theta CCMP2712]